MLFVCSRCGKEMEVEAPFCKECHRQILNERESAPENSPAEAVPQVENYNQAPVNDRPRKKSGALKWGVLLIGGVLILSMIILPQVMGVSAGIIGTIISFAVFGMAVVAALHFMYDKFVILTGRICEFYASRNARPGIIGVMLMAIGILSYIFFVSMGASPVVALPALVLAVPPLLLLIIRFKGEFLKFLLLQIVCVPIVFAQSIPRMFLEDAETNVTYERNTFTGKKTKTYWQGTYPDVIDQDGRLLYYVYSGMGWFYYAQADGAVYHVILMGIINDKTGQGNFKITPVYNQNNPRPRWIAWLY